MTGCCAKKKPIDGLAYMLRLLGELVLVSPDEAVYPPRTTVARALAVCAYWQYQKCTEPGATVGQFPLLLAAQYADRALALGFPARITLLVASAVEDAGLRDQERFAELIPKEIENVCPNGLLSST